MAFKQNLLKKIRIDTLAETVIASIGLPDSEKKTDKSAMRELLEMSSYAYRKERDMDLYVSDNAAKHKILVLDNELAFYSCEAREVGLRKSPTVREMLNVFNVIRILNDSDVVVCKRDASVGIIRQDCLSALDLSYTEADIEEIGIDGMASLESSHPEGVIESLSLFAELLGYVPAPKVFRIDGNHVIGAIREKGKGEILIGPVIMYDRTRNTLRCVEGQIGSKDKEGIEFLRNVASGKEKASCEGTSVFSQLRESAKADMSIR